MGNIKKEESKAESIKVSKEAEQETNKQPVAKALITRTENFCLKEQSENE